eukprot:2323755-Rhodomonas_salina.5
MSSTLIAACSFSVTSFTPASVGTLSEHDTRCQYRIWRSECMQSSESAPVDNQLKWLGGCFESDALVSHRLLPPALLRLQFPPQPLLFLLLLTLPKKSLEHLECCLQV